MISSRTKIDDPDLADLLEGIHAGRVALPNFQRDFDWSDSDVRALLATVINGWPMGSLLLIDGDEKTDGFYDPRAFEHAPPLSGVPQTIVLDGQQRLTALYSALFQRSELVYALQIDKQLDWAQIDSIDTAMRTIKLRFWNRDYPTPFAQWEKRLLPIAALKSPSTFYEWRDAAVASEEDVLELTSLYRERLAGLHRYRVPALRIDRETPPAAVARIFERVNKTGQRLGSFDLMVAKSFTPEFNLRVHWEDAKAEFPKLGRFYGEDGNVPLQVIALRVLDDVRTSTVLQLTAASIHDNWRRAIVALNDALYFADRMLGVNRADWVPYGNMMVVLGALAWDGPLGEPARTRDIEAWFWRSAFSGRYAVGSNTTAVSDFKALRTSPSTMARDFSVDQASLLESTKQSSGALHRAWLCAMAAEYRRRIARFDDADFGARNVLKGVKPRDDISPHLLSLGFCLMEDGNLLKNGPFLEQVDNFNPSDPQKFLVARAHRLVEFLSSVSGARVQLAVVNSAPDVLTD